MIFDVGDEGSAFIKIINAIYEVLYNNKDINSLIEIIPNISYGTGLCLDKNKPNSNRKMQ